MKLYAGIGSRNTPPGICFLMSRIAYRLATRGYILRSGGAAGADSAFQAGAESIGAAEIWHPWHGFNAQQGDYCYPTERHFQQASLLHPAWAKLSHGAKALHARNTGQVMGADLKTPVGFVLCWTKDGCECEADRKSGTGGTATAIVYADRLGIPVFNLAREDAFSRLTTHVLANVGK